MKSHTNEIYDITMKPDFSQVNISHTNIDMIKRISSQ